MRKLIKLVFALIFLLIIAVIAAVFYIDTIAKAAIEHGGTYALGVETNVESADVKIIAGEFAMSGLDVANAQGFSDGAFMKLGDANVAVSLASLREPVVELPHLNLSDLELSLEKKEGKSNYQVILDSLKRFEAKEPPPDAQRFIIRQLDIENVKVKVDLLGGGQLTKINVPIDSIKLKDVGSDSDRGVLLGDLLGVILKAVLAAVVDKAGSVIPPDLTNDLKNGLAQLGDLSKVADVESLGKVAGDITTQAENLTKDVEKLGESVKDDLKNVTDGLGGLIPGKKKSE